MPVSVASQSTRMNSGRATETADDGGTRKRTSASLESGPKGRIKHGAELEKHRTNVREVLLWSNATPIRCRGGIGYACCFCADQYPVPADLKRHCLERHGGNAIATFMKGRDMHGYFVKLDVTALRCSVCDEPADTLEHLMEHLKSAHSKNIDLTIKNHMMPFKFDTEELRCCVCSNAYHRFQALQVHMNSHRRNYVCEVCDAGFVNRHMLRCHSDGHKTGAFGCDRCPKVFKTHRALKLHERVTHSRSMPHKCGYCGERFKENFNKNEHLARVHGVRAPSVKCQACERTFDTQQRWLLHMKRDHLMLRQHKCGRCEKAFYARRELTDHMVKHTGLREFRCELCSKSYGRLKTLKEHIRRLHPDDDRFKCGQCGWTFVHAATLRKHVADKHG
ncbi:unnamed protein product, partial [Iphiclides podalirius]